MINAITIILFCFFGPGPSSKDCTNNIRNLLDKLSFSEMPSGRTTYHLAFTIKSRVKSPSGQLIDESSEVAIFLNATKYVYQSDKFTMLADSNSSFAILHPSRQIIWSEGVKITSQRSLVDQLTSIRSILISNSNRVTCQGVTMDSVNYNNITVVLGETDRRIAGVTNVTYLINTDLDQLERVRVNYEPASQKVWVEYVLHSLEMDYKGFSEEPVSRLVFNKNDQLRESLKGYMLMDRRRSKKATGKR